MGHALYANERREKREVGGREGEKGGREGREGRKGGGKEGKERRQGEGWRREQIPGSGREPRWIFINVDPPSMYCSPHLRRERGGAGAVWVKHGDWRGGSAAVRERPTFHFSIPPSQSTSVW